MNDPPRGYVDDDRGTANTIAVVFTVAIMTTSAIIAGAALTSNVQQDASTGAQVEQATVTAQTGDKLRITPEIGNQLPLDGITVKVTLESGRTVTISDVSQALAVSQRGAPQQVQVAQSESDDDDNVGVEQSDDADESVIATADVPVYRWEKDTRTPVYTWEKSEAQEVPKYQWSKQYTTEEPVYNWKREITRTKSRVARSDPGLGSLSTYMGTSSDWSRAGVDHTEQKQVGTEQVLDHYETERYLSHFTRTRERVQTGYTYSYERVQTGYSYSYERVQTGYRYERNCRTVGGWYGYGGVTRCSTDRVPTYDYQRTREPTYDIRRTREPTYDYRYTREPVYDTRKKPVYREEPVYETVRYYTWEKEVTTTQTKTSKSAPGSNWERAGIDHYDTVTETKYQTGTEKPGSGWTKVKQVGTVTQQTRKTTVSRTHPGEGWSTAGVDHYESEVKTMDAVKRPGPEWERKGQARMRTAQMQFADTNSERGGSALAQNGDRDGDRDESDDVTVTIEGYEFAEAGNANALNNADENGIVNGLSNAFGLGDEDNPGLGVRVDGNDDAAVEQTVSGVGGDIGSTQARSWATGESFVVDLENDVLDTGDVVRVQVINDQSNELLLDKRTRLTNPYLSTSPSNPIGESPDNPGATPDEPSDSPGAPETQPTSPAPQNPPPGGDEPANDVPADRESPSSDDESPSNNGPDTESTPTPDGMDTPYEPCAENQEPEVSADARVSVDMRASGEVAYISSEQSDPDGSIVDVRYKPGSTVPVPEAGKTKTATVTVEDDCGATASDVVLIGQETDKRTTQKTKAQEVEYENVIVVRLKSTDKSVTPIVKGSKIRSGRRSDLPSVVSGEISTAPELRAVVESSKWTVVRDHVVVGHGGDPPHRGEDKQLGENATQTEIQYVTETETVTVTETKLKADVTPYEKSGKTVRSDLNNDGKIDIIDWRRQYPNHNSVEKTDKDADGDGHNDAKSLDEKDENNNGKAEVCSKGYCMDLDTDLNNNGKTNNNNNGGANNNAGSNDNNGGANNNAGSNDNNGGANNNAGSNDNNGGANNNAGSNDNNGGANNNAGSNDNNGGANNNAGSNDDDELNDQAAKSKMSDKTKEAFAKYAREN